MGKPHQLFLDDMFGPNIKIYGCQECKSHLTHGSSLISKAFSGHHGRAWLFNDVVNVVEGPPTNRSMTTGLHTVSDIICTGCKTVIGWKYIKAFKEDQKYKEGKFILERTLLMDVAQGEA
ncbi:hypothetical protein HDV05_003814 [Chytridiales sp. JEL 0842]|nr:hypothetical protein HDV05_003814 [Chytridiales sp. JEL 0842]